MNPLQRLAPVATALVLSLSACTKAPPAAKAQPDAGAPAGPRPFEGEIGILLGPNMPVLLAVKGKKVHFMGTNALILDGDTMWSYELSMDEHEYAETLLTPPPRSKRPTIDTGRTDTIAGYVCHVVRIGVEGKGPITEACVTKEPPFADGVGPFALVGGLTFEAELAEGFALRIAHIDESGVVKDTTVVISVEPKPMSDALFKVPEGFTKGHSKVPKGGGMDAGR